MSTIHEQPEDAGPSQSGGRQRAPAIPETQWEGLKETIHQVYMIQKKPMVEFMKYMKDKHNFSPSEQQYWAKFRKWGFSKNTKNSRTRSRDPEQTNKRRRTDQGTLDVQPSTTDGPAPPPSDQMTATGSSMDRWASNTELPFDDTTAPDLVDLAYIESLIPNGNTGFTENGLIVNQDPSQNPGGPPFASFTNNSMGDFYSVEQMLTLDEQLPVHDQHGAVTSQPSYPSQDAAQSNGYGYQGNAGYNKDYRQDYPQQVHYTNRGESMPQQPPPRNSTSTTLRQPIHQVAQSGFFERVEFLVEIDSECVHVLGADGVSPLWVAAQEGHTKIVQLLIDKKADPDITVPESKRAAIHQAAQNGHRGIVELLLKHGAKPDPRDCNGITPLWSAAQEGYHDIVKLLVDKGADPNISSYNDRRPIHQAAQNGHVRVVKLLLDNKTPEVEFDQEDSTGITPLWSASQGGYPEIVKMLLERKADVEVTSKDGSRRPIHQAAQNGHLETVRRLLRHGAIATPEKDTFDDTTPSPLWLAAQKGDVAIGALLIEKDADVDFSISPSRRRPIHQAVQNGHIEFVRLLIRHKADLDAEEEDGWPAIMIAAQQGYMEIVKLLIDNRANIGAEEKDGATALWIASQQGHADIVELLLKHGARSFSTRSAGRRPIHQATQNGHFEATKVLVKYEPEEVDVADQKGWRPLTFASQGEGSNRLDMMKYLVEKGAKVSSE